MKKSFLLACTLLIIIASVVFAADIKVQYRDGDHENATDNHIKPHLKIFNNDAESVNLKDVKIRYYYSKETLAPEAFHVDYAYIGGNNVTGTFFNDYVEIGFTSGAGSIAGFSDSGEIQIRFNKEDWSDYNETNDYSYKCPATTYSFSEKITVYLKGLLVCGLEPGGSTSIPATPLPGITPEPRFPFIESDGMVVLEAEHFSSTTPGSGAAANSSWKAISYYKDASNGSALVANPNNNVNVGDTTKGPGLGYQVYFSEIGTYYFWVRMWGPTASDDSLHCGLDGIPASYGKSGMSITSYYWKWTNTALGSVTVNVETSGLHTINIWMREDGTRIDKILLTTDSGFVPSGQGPAESPQGIPATPEPSPIPTSNELPNTGLVWIQPGYKAVTEGEDFSLELRVNSGDQKLAAYGIEIEYDTTIVAVDTSLGNHGVDDGPDGFIAAVNANNPGTLIISGFNTDGTGPGENLHVLTLYFTAVSPGESILVLSIVSLVNPMTLTIGNPSALNGRVIVEALPGTPVPAATELPPAVTASPDATPLPSETPGPTQEPPNDPVITPIPGSISIGDVNNDGMVNIIDALLCAQYFVGLNISNFIPANSDVNYDGSITIVDALLIAQYYVGLLAELPGLNPTPGGDPTPLPAEGVGNVWISPTSIEVAEETSFTTEVHINSGSQRLAAYALEITYDPSLISLDSSAAVTDGPNGLSATITNTNTPGTLIISSFEPAGIPVTADAFILEINWYAAVTGTGTIDITVHDLVDVDANVIGIPNGTGSTLTIQSKSMPTPIPSAGQVFLVPASQSVNLGSDFTSEIHINSGDQSIAAYGIDLTYDSNILRLVTYEAGPDGYVAAASASTVGTVRMSGFDAIGTGPGTDLNFLRLSWTAIATGTSTIQIIVNTLVSSDSVTVGIPFGIGGTVIVQAATPEPDFVVQYRCGVTSDLTNMIRPYLNIKNAGTETVPLEELTLRYYYTKESAVNEEIIVDYAAFGKENVIGTLADVYMEIGFTPEAGSLKPGSETGQILLGVMRHDSDPYDQSDDYSHDPAYTEFADYDRITLYRNGILSCGVPPSASTPDPTPIVTSTPTATPTTTPTLTPTPTSTPSPIPDPTEVPPPGTGDVYFVPDTKTADEGEHFTTEIHINSGYQKIAAYGFFIYYDKDVVQVDTEQGKNGVIEGPYGYIADVNSLAGELRITGFNSIGTGPGSDLLFLTIYWVAVAPGTTPIEFEVDTLIDNTYYDIGTPVGRDGNVTVIATTPTPEPSPTPDPTATPEPVEGVGNVWVSPSSISVDPGDLFTTEIHVNSGNQMVSSYGFEITFNPAIISLNESVGVQGVEESDEGFLSTIKVNPGVLRVSGVDYGAGPSPDILFLTINWKALASGTSPIDLTVESLTDNRYLNIGTPNDLDGTVTVTGSTIDPDAGLVWFYPEEKVIRSGVSGSIELRLNSGNQKVAAYGFELYFDETILEINTEMGNNGVEAGADGYVTAVNPGNPGVIIFNGFDVFGIGPGDNLHLVTVHFNGIKAGQSALTLEIDTLIDAEYNDVGTPHSIPGTIKVMAVDGPDDTPVPTIAPTIVPTTAPIITEEPTPVPTYELTEDVGKIWFVPSTQTMTTGSSTTTELHINTGNNRLAAYGIDIAFDSSIVDVKTNIGINGAEAGADGFVTAVAYYDGLLRTSGFDVSGTGPKDDLHFLTIHWIGIGPGTSELTMEIRDLTNEAYATIGNPTGIPGSITVVGD
ncbi:MAG: hypothetical protein JXJ04_03775 [Spirochaetales bacterium]|nr:hypothetical protein [Spirochaetales bacterium]